MAALRTMIPALAAAALAGVGPLSADAQVAGPEWGCDAPAGRTCYFSIQVVGGGVRNFSLPAGRRVAVTGVTPGQDHYFMSLDVPSLADANRCRQLIAGGHLCRVKIVDPTYND